MYLRRFIRNFSTRIFSLRKQLTVVCLSLAVLHFMILRNLESSIGSIITKETNPKATPVHTQAFKEYNTAETESLHMVCLTDNMNKESPHLENYIQGIWFAKDKQYVLPVRHCKLNQKHIIVYHDSPRRIARQYGRFRVHFRPITELPSNHKIIENRTAYFLGFPIDFEPLNFYHFTKQVFFPLYWLVKSTNQLYEGAKNVVFYPDIYALCPENEYLYHDISKFKYFRQILNVEDKLELSAFNDKPEPHNVCYKNAIFSPELFLDKASEATDYFKQTIGVKDSLCMPNILVIINRSNYRRILNTDELQKIGKEMGYDTRVVSLETLTLKEQAQLIHCTKVLVGVVGAGLQWAFFMKNHSGVIEIAWPHAQWPFFFTGTQGYHSFERDVIRPLRFARVGKAWCRMNPDAINIYYQESFYTNKSFSYEESVSILEDGRNFNFRKSPVTSIGKLCDVLVDGESFRKAIFSLEEK